MNPLFFPGNIGRSIFYALLTILLLLCLGTLCSGQTLFPRMNKRHAGAVQPQTPPKAPADNPDELPPTITSITHSAAGNSTVIIVVGTNFADPTTLMVNGVGPYTATKVTADTATFTIPGSPLITDIIVSTDAGSIEQSAAAPATGSADLNLPDFGNGLTVIPTPSFDYSQIYLGNTYAFTERLWGNSLSSDTTRQKMGAKFLMPDVSLFGLKFEVDRRFTNQKSPFSLGAALECNFLVKKVSDTSGKATNNFNPFVFHPRLGLVSSFFDNNVFVAVYTNFLSVVGSNDQFAAFFNTHSKNVFVYPEVDLGGLLSISASGNQALKFQLNLIVNNGDAQFISGSHDTLIPSLKIGFVSTL